MLTCWRKVKVSQSAIDCIGSRKWMTSARGQESGAVDSKRLCSGVCRSALEVPMKKNSGPALWQQTLATVVIHNVGSPTSRQRCRHFVQEPLREALSVASASLADARHILQHPPGQGAMVGQVQDPHGHHNEDACPSIHLDEPLPDAAERGTWWA